MPPDLHFHNSVLRQVFRFWSYEALHLWSSQKYPVGDCQGRSCPLVDYLARADGKYGLQFLQEWVSIQEDMVCNV